MTLPLGEPGAAGPVAEIAEAGRAHRQDRAVVGVAQLKAGRGRTFYAVGGTWRALARIHIIQSGYPLRVMHGYSIPATGGARFRPRLRRLATAEQLANIEVVADARRPLLTYAALVLEYIIARRQAEDDRVLDLRRARGPAVRDAAAARNAPRTD